MPFPGVAHVEREMREPDAVPRALHQRLLRLKLEDLEHRAAGHADPTNLAAGCWCIDAEEGADPLRRRIGDADQRAAEYVPVKADERVEVADGDADVGERSRLHNSS